MVITYMVMSLYCGYSIILFVLGYFYLIVYVPFNIFECCFYVVWRGGGFKIASLFILYTTQCVCSYNKTFCKDLTILIIY